VIFSFPSGVYLYLFFTTPWFFFFVFEFPFELVFFTITPHNVSAYSLPSQTTRFIRVPLPLLSHLPQITPSCFLILWSFFPVHVSMRFSPSPRPTLPTLTHRLSISPVCLVSQPPPFSALPCPSKRLGTLSQSPKIPAFCLRSSPPQKRPPRPTVGTLTFPHSRLHCSRHTSPSSHYPVLASFFLVSCQRSS